MHIVANPHHFPDRRRHERHRPRPPDLRGVRRGAHDGDHDRADGDGDPAVASRGDRGRPAVRDAAAAAVATECRCDATECRCGGGGSGSSGGGTTTGGDHTGRDTGTCLDTFS